MGRAFMKAKPHTVAFTQRAARLPMYGMRALMLRGTLLSISKPSSAIRLFSLNVAYGSYSVVVRVLRDGARAPVFEHRYSRRAAAPAGTRHLLSKGISPHNARTLAVAAASSAQQTHITAGNSRPGS